MLVGEQHGPRIAIDEAVEAHEDWQAQRYEAHFACFLAGGEVKGIIRFKVRANSTKGRVYKFDDCGSSRRAAAVAFQRNKKGPWWCCSRVEVGSSEHVSLASRRLAAASQRQHRHHRNNVSGRTGHDEHKHITSFSGGRRADKALFWPNSAHDSLG